VSTLPIASKCLAVPPLPRAAWISTNEPSDVLSMVSALLAQVSYKTPQKHLRLLIAEATAAEGRIAQALSSEPGDPQLSPSKRDTAPS
jgi:hypothetical protein